MRTEELAIDGGTLACTISGPDSGRLLLLAHGIADSQSAFRFLAPSLAEAGYLVVNIDIRGCGGSSTGWSGYTRTDVANDMIQVIRRFSIQEPAFIIGHSISGGAATIAAALEPDLIGGIIELAPFTRKQSFGASDLFRTGVARLMGAIMFSSPRLWLSYLEAAMPGTQRPDDWKAERQRIKERLGNSGRMAAFKQMCLAAPLDADEKLKDVKCPTLIIEGSLDCDFASPRGEGEAIVAAMSQGTGRLVVIDGAGHYPHFQYPSQTLASIQSFLEEVTRK